MGPTRLRLDPPLELAAIAARLAPGLRVETGEVEEGRVLHLDTFDWLLHDAGARLERERDGDGERWWWWEGAAAPGRVLPFARPARFARDLPPGWLREAVEPLIGFRALLEHGETLRRRQLLRVLDADGAVSLRVWWEEVTPLDRDGRPAPPQTLLRLEPVGGAEAELAGTLELLATTPGASPAPLDDLELAAATRGRRPGDYSGKVRLALHEEQPAGGALAAILAELLAVVSANHAGVVADLDSEFLHDLRVAVRRARSALALLGEVLSPELSSPLEGELRWLGAATGPCRDLDVFSLELADLEGGLRPATVTALAPLEAAVAGDRARAHRALVRALTCRRFARLGRAGRQWSRPRRGSGRRRALCRSGGWSTSVSPPPTGGWSGAAAGWAAARPPSRSTGSASRPRSCATCSSCSAASTRRGTSTRWSARSSSCRTSWAGSRTRWSSSTASRRCRHGSSPKNARGRPTLLAVGRLAARLEARQDALRAGFSERFAAFAGPATRAAVERLVSGRGEG